ncbi:V-type ATP synthase subunit D [Rubrobacter marinus]|uniref:V-type ATP synthase subunit D n=1 Tax=Rubrobacter marinus TaxID=2653852 RepID=A0A6G8PW50_9ACTN|nr:V-type ATP synthase subunit D [Rubrobacter marinus]QIN78395.1 V-type ATP synthase subunit D [Rubrobacter marinus]
MRRVSATRSELLGRRARISLAETGRDLLKEKRTALMREFDRLSRSALAAMRDLEDRAGEARASLGEAVALDGPEAVGSAALAASGDVGVELETKSVAGVPIVELDHEPVRRARDARGYSLSATTPRVDRAAEDFEAVLEGLLDVVAVEISLRRLAEEISQTTRRVNALENVVVPGLEEERDYIAMVLDEREMESRVRLMRAKGCSEKEGKEH